MSEVRYGSFVRTVPLPPGLDLDRAEARVKSGVLTVQVPEGGRAARLAPHPDRTMIHYRA